MKFHVRQAGLGEEDLPVHVPRDVLTFVARLQMGMIGELPAVDDEALGWHERQLDIARDDDTRAALQHRSTKRSDISSSSVNISVSSHGCNRWPPHDAHVSANTACRMIRHVSA